MLYDELLEVSDLKIYIESNFATIRKRYLKRANGRGQKTQEVIKQFEIVTKAAQKYVIPRKKYADIIIDGAIINKRKLK